MIDDAATNGLEITEVPIDVKYDDVDGQTYNPVHHGLSVMVFLLKLIRDRHPMVFFGLPGVLMLVFGGLLGFHSVYTYQSSGVFYQWRLLGSGFITLLGMMALFSGLVLNQIANMMENIS